MAVDVDTHRPRISTVTGGYSGPSIRPIALAKLYEVRKSVSLPLIGIGGISSAADALEFIAAWRFPPTGPPPLVWVSGPDAWLWFNCAVVVLLGSASVWAFRRLAKNRPSSPESS